MPQQTHHETLHFLRLAQDLGRGCFAVFGWRGPADKMVDLERKAGREMDGFKKPLTRQQAMKAMRGVEERMKTWGFRRLASDLPVAVEYQFKPGQGGRVVAKALLGQLARGNRDVAAGLAAFSPGCRVHDIDAGCAQYPLALHLAYLGILSVRINGRVMAGDAIAKLIVGVKGRGRDILDSLQAHRVAHDNMAARIGGVGVQSLVL